MDIHQYIHLGENFRAVTAFKDSWLCGQVT